MWRNFLFTSLILILSAFILYTTLLNLDPLGEQRMVALFAFFLSIFFGVSALMTFIFFFSSELFSGRKLGNISFFRALRRGILVGIFVVVLFLLQFFRFLGWLEGGLLVLFLILIEFIFLSRSRK